MPFLGLLVSLPHTGPVAQCCRPPFRDARLHQTRTNDAASQSVPFLRVSAPGCHHPVSHDLPTQILLSWGAVHQPRGVCLTPPFTPIDGSQQKRQLARSSAALSLTASFFRHHWILLSRFPHEDIFETQHFGVITAAVLIQLPQRNNRCKAKA